MVCKIFFLLRILRYSGKSVEKRRRDNYEAFGSSSKHNNKSPGNDGLTKEFYETFWDETINFFYKSVKDARTKKELVVAQ